MKGKTVLITGATLGIGKEAAVGLARLGARVVIVGRDAARTQEAVAFIRREARSEAVDSMLADLSSLAEVRRLAADFKRKHDRLDVLLNNAGAMFETRATTVDGFERTWGLNHLSYVALTLEALDLLKKSAPARVVSVASDAHKGGRLNFEDLQGENAYSALRAYAQSKLANIMFTYALSRRLAGTGVTANCLHPGAVATGFGAGTTGLLGLLLKLIRPFMLSAEAGARTSIWAASAPELERVSGKYFVKCGEAVSTKASRDEAAQERLWALSLEQLGVPAR